MGEFVEGIEKREWEEEMDEKGSFCILERESLCGWHKTRSSQMQPLPSKWLECSSLYSGS